MILSIASQKGGVGKTTTSISLAAGLARQGKKVLLIDIDSQANSSKVLVDDFPQLHADQSIYVTIIDRKPLPVRPSTIPNLDVVPSHILLSNTDVKLTTAIDHREARLKTQLDAIRDRYEHVIIDCPPALSWLTINAFTASDRVLIPVAPGYFELDSIVQISKTVQEVREYFNPQIGLAGRLPLHHVRPDHQCEDFAAHPAPDLHRRRTQDRHSAQHRHPRRTFSPAGCLHLCPALQVGPGLPALTR